MSALLTFQDPRCIELPVWRNYLNAFTVTCARSENATALKRNVEWLDMMTAMV